MPRRHHALWPRSQWADQQSSTSYRGLHPSGVKISGNLRMLDRGSRVDGVAEHFWYIRAIVALSYGRFTATRHKLHCERHSNKRVDAETGQAT